MIILKERFYEKKVKKLEDEIYTEKKKRGRQVKVLILMGSPRKHGNTITLEWQKNGNHSHLRISPGKRSGSF